MAHIRQYTFEEYVDRVTRFHGYPAPGVIVGGFMVERAYHNLPEEGLYDALCETTKCLPDSIQLLTPCTIGNGWLTIVNIGRYALALYDKSTGEGVRVFVDSKKLEAWPELKSWFFKLKPKKEQDRDLLTIEIKEAGSSICSVQRIRMAERFYIKQRHRGDFAVCPSCHEGYPENDGSLCKVCAGIEKLYETWCDVSG
jgi:formylmethanofuran dehydrogenase subunit E